MLCAVVGRGALAVLAGKIACPIGRRSRVAVVGGRKRCVVACARWTVD